LPAGAGRLGVALVEPIAGADRVDAAAGIDAALQHAATRSAPAVALTDILQRLLPARAASHHASEGQRVSAASAPPPLPVYDRQPQPVLAPQEEHV
jgi:hypothetical protein